MRREPSRLAHEIAVWLQNRGMARRADPERIFQARRDAIRNTLTGSGMSLETAERWCDAWEIEAGERRLPRDADYWLLGAEWIAVERAAR